MKELLPNLSSSWLAMSLEKKEKCHPTAHVEVPSPVVEIAPTPRRRISVREIAR